MKININYNQEIIGYSIIGSVPGAIEVDDSILPTDFILSFKPKLFLYDGEKVIKNASYQEPQPPIVKDVQNPLQVALGQLTLQVATLQEDNKKLSESLGQMALMMAKQNEEGGK